MTMCFARQSVTLVHNNGILIKRYYRSLHRLLGSPLKSPGVDVMPTKPYTDITDKQWTLARYERSSGHYSTNEVYGAYRLSGGNVLTLDSVGTMGK